jgi:predicted NBD/HSP70 family sugar kinase
MATKSKKTATNPIDILEVLTKQHAEVDELFAALEAGDGDRAAVFQELADKLAAHAAAEEQMFYPNVMHAQTKQLLEESVEEHLVIKRTLADMLVLDPDGDDEEKFDAKLSVLKESVSHHAHEEEEDKLFPILRKLMSDESRAALGEEFLSVFDELMTRQPRLEVPDQTVDAAPLPHH